MDAPRRCPRCISDEVIRNLYGTPSPELLEEARSGRVALGAVMCFGPKHPSGCALDVSTSGAKTRRNGDLSRKAHESSFHIFCSFHTVANYPSADEFRIGKNLPTSRTASAFLVEQPRHLDVLELHDPSRSIMKIRNHNTGTDLAS